MLQVSITGTTPLANAYWTGGLSGATNVWAESDGTANSNWAATSGGPVHALVPGSSTSVIVSSSSITAAPTSAVLGANMTINNLTIADTVNGLGLNADGNTLTISPTSTSTGITMNFGVPASAIGANVVLGAAQTWTNNSGSTLTISGAISGTSGLTLAGSGTIVLFGANSYTGTTTVSAGTLTLTNNAALQNSILTAGGMGIVFSSTVPTHALTFGDLSGSGNLALTDNGSNAVTLTVGGSNDSPTYSGSLSGLGGLTKTGTGAFTLSGTSANTYTGQTTVTSGALILSKTAGVPAVPGNLVIDGGASSLGNVRALANNQLGGANTVVSSNNAAGVASLTLLGTTQTVAGLNSPAGGLMVANSTTDSGTPSPANGSASTLILTGSGSYTDDGWIWNNWLPSGSSTGTLALTLNMGSTGVQTLTGVQNTAAAPPRLTAAHCCSKRPRPSAPT